MERAAEVQRALVPHRGSVDVPGYQIVGSLTPARSVGDDLVDWFPAADGDVVVTLGDVMGEGIGAALMAAPERTVYLEPGDIVVAFSDGLLDRFDSIDATIDAIVAGVRKDPGTVIERLEEANRMGPLTVRRQSAPPR